MGNRNWDLLLTFMVGVAISLAPMSAAAQNQTQPPHNTSTLHFDPIANPRATCPPGSDKPAVKKTRLLALPANVIEPQKTPDGWPDLQGTWSSAPYPGVAGGSVEFGENILDQDIQCQARKDPKLENLLVDPMKGRIPYQPWAKAKQMELLAAQYAPQRRMDLPPHMRCFDLEMVPHGSFAGTMEIRFIPGAVVFLQATGRPGKGTRIVPMDGSPHLNSDLNLFQGDSRGHWEGHTLVIETTNNRDGTWFDTHGTIHSQALRVIERITMVSQDTLYYEATIIDPTVFTQTWKMAQNFDRRRTSGLTDPQAHQYTCHEEDTAGERIVRAGLRARAVGLFGYRLDVDLKTGKALDPDDQKYLDQSGQPLGYDFAPAVPDSALPKGFNYTYTPPPDADSKAKDGSASH